MSGLNINRFIEETQIREVLRLHRSFGLDNPWGNPAFEAAADEQGEDMSQIPWGLRQVRLIARKITSFALNSEPNEVDRFLQELELLQGSVERMPFEIRDSIARSRQFHSLDSTQAASNKIVKTVPIIWSLSESKLTSFLNSLRNDHGWIADGLINEFKSHFSDTKGNSFAQTSENEQFIATRIQWKKSANLFSYLISQLKREGVLPSRQYWVEVVANFSNRDGETFDKARLRKKSSKIKSGGSYPTELEHADRIIGDLI